MRRLIITAICCFAAIGCKKSSTSDSAQASNSTGQYSGGGNPTVMGAQQAVRKAANRTVTAAELHDLHLFMSNAKVSTGKTPTAGETWAALNQPGGNAKLVQLIKDGVIVLVNNPGEEGLWAYAADARTAGGFVLTHSGPERVTPAEFQSRFPMN